MKVTPQILTRVAYDNMRDNQIGGMHDGIDWEVARDIGYIPPDEAARLPITHYPDAPKRLTSAEQMANERKAIVQHLGRTVKQVIDPHY